MPEAYSKPCQISKMMRHIEIAGIVRTVYLGIFRHVQGHLAILRHTQAYWVSSILRSIELYSDIFRSLCNPCIYNRAMFSTRAHLEHEISSKVYQRCKISMYIQSPGIVRTFSRIFRDIQGYLRISIFIHPHRHPARGKEERPLLPSNFFQK